MTKKSFLFVVALFFSIQAIVEFLRMMFSWDVFIGGVEIPAWVSGMLFIFSIFMIYWSFLLAKKEEETPVIEEEKDEQSY